MNDFPKTVLQWLPLIKEEIALKNYPFVSELILSLMTIESGGRAGIVNPNSGASGLLQVMPKTLDDYNRKNRSNIPLAALRSTNEKAAQQQIRVGLWVLGEFWKHAYKWLREFRETIPVDELVKWSDSFYAAGPARIKDMAVNHRTWQSWEAIYPQSSITKHADFVWSTTQSKNPQWDLKKIDGWVESDSKIKKNQQGLVIALLILAFASLALKFLDKGKQHGSRAKTISN